MSQEEKTYTLEEMDVMMKEHIKNESEILRNNLREKRQVREISYV